MSTFANALALGGLLSLVLPIPVQALNGRLEADRGEFRLRLDDGRVLERQALIGTRVVIRSGTQDVTLLIDAVEEENSTSGKPIVLYRLLIDSPEGQRWHDACEPDTRGRRLGLPLLKETGIAITCTSGAEGKCILMGYRPWEASANAPMRDLHAACIHLVRADYGGDDHATTRDGTVIDVYDRFGIQKPETTDSMPFEAAWGKHGAVCVAHPRIAQNVTLDDLAKAYPRLRDTLGSEACTEEAMRGHPEVLLFNRSAPTAP
ncbi:ADYC domain-containing protein [Microvirga sp. VF16]|uniref:ADYC domain-containing protein n=1 Tax=Microvirga sp. VF16 TaxID=2807101 RepID=UPI00193CD58A|nr:ADYC domain-containing protein [Microvirga sp. VF16]QRM28565.1 hypothetical protein JO965_20390 [Microvirga sp. VF16]